MLQNISTTLEHTEEFFSYRGVEACYNSTEVCAKCDAKGQITLYCPRCRKNYCMLNCVRIENTYEGTTNSGTKKFCPVCNMLLQTWEIEHQPELVCDNCGRALERDDAEIVICGSEPAYLCYNCLLAFKEAMEIIKKRFDMNYLKDEDKYYVVNNYVKNNISMTWQLNIRYPIYYILKGLNK